MATRLQLTPQEIINLYKPSDPPPFFDNFGPVKYTDTFKPFSLDRQFKKIPKPQEVPQQQPIIPVFAPVVSQNAEPNVPLFSPAPAPAPRAAPAKDATSNVDMPIVEPPTSTPTSDVKPEPVKIISFESVIAEMKEDEQKQTKVSNPVFQPQIKSPINTEPYIPFNPPAAAPIEAPVAVVEEKPVEAQPVEVVVTDFKMIEKEEMMHVEKPAQIPIATQRIHIAEKPSLPVASFDAIEREQAMEAPEAPPIASPVKKQAPPAYEPVKQTPVPAFDEIIKNEESKEESKPKRQNNKNQNQNQNMFAEYKPKQPAPKVDFEEIVSEQRKAAPKPPKPTPQNPIVYDTKPKLPTVSFDALESEAKRNAPPVAQPVALPVRRIKYGTAPTATAVKPSFAELENAEQTKKLGAAEQTKKSEKKKGAKYTPYTPPAREAFAPAVAPPVVAFEALEREEAKTSPPSSSQIQNQNQQSKKGKKAKYTPFVPETKPAPVQAQNPQPKVSSFDKLMAAEAKAKPAAPPQPQLNPPKAKGKKGKFVPYEEIKPAPQKNAPQKAAPSGPSFEELMAAEAKNGPSFAPEPAKKKRGKKVILDTVGSFEPQVAKYDPDEADRLREERNAAMRAVAKKAAAGSSSFAALMAAEEKREKKIPKIENAFNGPSYKAQARGAMAGPGPSFAELMAKEEQREAAFDGPMLVLDQSPASFAAHQEREKPKRQQKKRAAEDDDLFWGGADIESGEVRAKPAGEYLSHNEFPTLGAAVSVAQPVRKGKAKPRREAKNAPAAWLATQLERNGMDPKEASDFAEFIADRGREAITDAIRSVLPASVNVTGIVNNYFRNFPSASK